MEQTSFHPMDYMAVVHRRKWWFIAPLVICLLAGAIAVMVWPRKYVSTAAIGVASPTLYPDLLPRGVSSMDPVERQRAISQLLLSPAVLERVVREEKIQPSKPVAEVANGLRANLAENISVPVPIGVANGRPDPTKGIDLFMLGYSDKKPDRAQRIANRVAYVFVEENSKVQTDRAANTSEMLAQEVSASHDRLQQLENELKTRKQANMGRLPEQANANVQILNGASSQLESISMQLRTEEDHLTQVESQISQMRQGIGAESMTTSGMYAVQAAQKRIDDLQAQLTQARALSYTEKHPEVVRLQDEIKHAQAELASAQQQAPESRDKVLQADPLYRQKLQERDMARLHIKELKAASAGAQRRIAEFQARVESAPAVEQELLSLDREYNLEKARYTDLSTRYQQARSAEDVARKQGGERFRVLYPASLPDTPAEPQPLKIMALALAAGLVLGAAAAIGREFLDRAVYDARSLQDEFQVAVLGEIPRIAV